MLHSGTDGEPVEVGLPTWSFCTGVRRRWLVAFAGWRGRRLSASEVRRWLLGLWKIGGWFGLEVPAAAVVVDSELCSEIQGARGVAPADGRLGDGLISFFGTSVHCGFFKAFVRWSTLRYGVVQRPEPAILRGGDLRRVRPAKGSGDLDVIFVFLWTSVQSGMVSSTLYPCTVYLYLYVFLNY